MESTRPGCQAEGVFCPDSALPELPEVCESLPAELQLFHPEVEMVTVTWVTLSIRSDVSQAASTVRTTVCTEKQTLLVCAFLTLWESLSMGVAPGGKCIYGRDGQSWAQHGEQETEKAEQRAHAPQLLKIN